MVSDDICGKQVLDCCMKLHLKNSRYGITLGNFFLMKIYKMATLQKPKQTSSNIFYFL